MSFSNRKFDFYILFGDIQNGKPLWNTDIWDSTTEPLINEILNLSILKHKTGVRVLEYNFEANNKKQSEIKLGRLKWDDKSHKKWTLKDKDLRRFAHFELWTPIWTECNKNDKSPDIYISISNENEMYKNCQFDYFIVIAIAKELGVNTKNIVNSLSEKFNTKKTVFSERTWGKGKTISLLWQ